MPIEKAERPRPVELLSELAAERVPAPPMPAGAAPDTAWKKWWCCDADVDGEGMATGWVVPSALSGSVGGVGRDEVEADDEACDAADAAAANPGESESDAAGETARRLKAWCAYGSNRSSLPTARGAGRQRVRERCASEGREGDALLRLPGLVAAKVVLGV